MKDHPILKGVSDIWGPSDVYGIRALTGDSQVLVHGQVLTGMEPTDSTETRYTDDADGMDKNIYR